MPRPSLDEIFNDAGTYSALEDKYQLPSGLLTAVAHNESRFNDNAVSSAGAQGRFQLMPDTAKMLGVTDPNDPVQAAEGAAKYLKQNLDANNGDISLAVAAYNAGPGNVKKYGGVPPFPETQKYVANVTSMLPGQQPQEVAQAGTEQTPEHATPATTARPSLDQIFSEVAPPAPTQPKQGAWDKYGQPFVDTFKQGVTDAKDFATMNYSDEHPMRDALHQKRQAGTADRHDYERAFLEGMSNSPPGKALGAVAGLVPELNVVTTALTKWINPAIVEKTGIDPAELQLLEIGAPMAAKGVSVMRGKPSAPAGPLPSAQALKAVGNAIMSPIDTAGKVVSGATKATMAAAKPVVQPIVRGIIEGDNPITGEPGLKTALASDTAAEGARIGQKLGINFSAGELTGNATAMGIEDALANSARYGGKFAEANQAKTQAVVKRYGEVLDKIYPQASSRADVGGRLSTAYNSTIDSLVKTRREQAAADAQAAGIATRGQPVINTDNFQQALIDFIDEGNSKLSTPAQKLAAKQAAPILKKLTDEPLISVKELQNGLAAFGDGAKSGSGIWNNLATASDRRFANAAKDALLQDMEASIQAGGKEAVALKQFRDNYRNNSNKIADIQQTTLGKIVGSAEHDSQGRLVISPEKIADRFTAMQPTELKNTLEFLDKNHPDVANMGRRYVLQRSLDKAVNGAGLRGVGTTKAFSKVEFVKNLPSEETLNALLKDPAAGKDIMDIAAATNRLIDYGAERKGSQTAQRTDILQSIAHWGKGVLYRSMIEDSLAEDLLNPAKRRAMATEVRKNAK